MMSSMGRGRDGENDASSPVGLSALIIAQARSVESRRPDRLVEDPFAEAFVSAAGPSFAANAPEIVRLLRLRGDYIAVRTRFFDDYLLGAWAAGCRQAVLLAAGLDARAFRLAWPDGVTLFELDLPEVLAFKERVLAGLSAQPRCHRVAVPVDLREDWPRALLAAGFGPDQDTAWLAEGILMYLAEEDRDRLLDAIGDLSAPGSRLALDQRGAPASPAAAAAEEERRAGDAAAARVGVLIPGRQAEPSVADLRAWLALHSWRANLHNAAERFEHYGRSAGQLAAEAAADLWLATAARD